MGEPLGFQREVGEGEREEVSIDEYFIHMIIDIHIERWMTGVEDREQQRDEL